MARWRVAVRDADMRERLMASETRAREALLMQARSFQERLEALEDALRRLGAQSGFPFYRALDDGPLVLDELLASNPLAPLEFECLLGVALELLGREVVVLGEARADQQPGAEQGQEDGFDIIHFAARCRSSQARLCCAGCCVQ